MALLMRGSSVVALVLLASTTTTLAQPGVMPRAVPLTEAEQELVDIGEISDEQQIGGGLLALTIGFGTGQAVQGRWSDGGWMIALGELLSVGAFLGGIAIREPDPCADYYHGCPLEVADSVDNTASDLMIIFGLLGFVVVRGASVIDALVTPRIHNGKLRELRARTGLMSVSVRPYAAPTHEGASGFTTGLTLRW